MSNATKRKKKRTAKRASSALAPPSPPQHPTVAGKGRLRQVGARILDSAVDSALDNIWPIVGGFIWSALVTITVALILYFKTGKASWLYPVLKYGLAFAAGWLTLLMFLVALVLLGLRRRRRKEKRKSESYFSAEKGPIDYRAELKPTIRNFQAVTTDLGREMARGGRSSGRIAKQMTLVAFSPVWTRRIASLGSRSLHKHAEKLERLSRRLDATGTAVLDNSKGNLHWAPTASQGNRDQLIAVKESLVVADNSLAENIANLENYRDKAVAIKVQGASQDLHGAVNHLVAVVESNIRVLKQMKLGTVEVFDLLDKKLRS